MSSAWILPFLCHEIGNILYSLIISNLKNKNLVIVVNNNCNNYGFPFLEAFLFFNLSSEYRHPPTGALNLPVLFP